MALLGSSGGTGLGGLGMMDWGFGFRRKGETHMFTSSPAQAFLNPLQQGEGVYMASMTLSE